ncbi:major capsid protein [Paenibacillus naphthalenovorans]|uniref:major capsid protein n=1 Tax=Paenibacillus naphthalenovorans TaxID=162209 RepID=UPI00088BE719|nr:major capsid protein [Paenibacillus naphthalenovorans]SDI49329.1 Phage major capsid protein E [Paenibacillus naphthalenovorans]
MSVNDIQTLGGTVLTELAKTFENRPTQLLAFFPVRDIQEKTVKVEKIYGGVGMARIVDSKTPDGFADGRKVETTQHDPIYSRESDNIPNDVVNSLRMPGTVNEKYGKKYVADQVKHLTNRNDTLYDFLRSQMFLGGIDYTDPVTGKRVQVDAGIPVDHKVNNTLDWDDVNVDFLEEIEDYILLIKKNGMVPPTHIVMNSTRRSKFSKNKKLRAYAETARDPGKVRFANGEITHICGLEIVEENRVYEELTSNGSGGYNRTVKQMMPDDKVVICCKEYEMEPLGRTDFVIGEHPDGLAGIWSRAAETQPPAAPGVLLQVGRAGMPYVRYPNWIVVVTIVDPTP